ncbi:hypothetical protein ACQ4PT_046366 [Festuca glaucescens]
MATKELSIKLVIDTKADKLCFAEAGSDVVEFLSCLLSLPLGTVASLLTKESMVGSIGNVLGSMEQLDANYKSNVLRLSPAVAPATLSRLQQLLGSHLSNTNLFTCEGPNCNNYPSTTFSFDNCTNRRANCRYLSATKGTACLVCKKPMDKPMTIEPDAKTNGPKVVAGSPTTHAIKHDLSVTPASNLLSGITLLAQCGVMDISALEEKTVKIGKEEALAILVASLKSKTVLTDVFLPKKNSRCKREPSEEAAR